MAGAYTAKPGYNYRDYPSWWDFDWTWTPEEYIPPEWDWNWEFPGAVPPGYEYDYSIALSGASAIGIDGAVALTSTVYDHGTFRTIDIADDVVQTWSASIDGVAVPLMASGSGSYASSYESGYSEFDSGFWGATPSLVFQLPSGSVGKTLVVAVTSLVGNETISDTIEIPIVDYVVTALTDDTTISKQYPTEGMHVVISNAALDAVTPPSGTIARISATSDGSPVTLRLSGVGEFVSSLDVNVYELEIENFHGIEEVIEYDIDTLEVDDVILLNVSVITPSSTISATSQPSLVVSDTVLKTSSKVSTLCPYNGFLVFITRIIDGDGVGVIAYGNVKYSATVGGSPVQVKMKNSGDFVDELAVPAYNISSQGYVLGQPMYGAFSDYDAETLNADGLVLDISESDSGKTAIIKIQYEDNTSDAEEFTVEIFTPITITVAVTRCSLDAEIYNGEIEWLYCLYGWYTWRPSALWNYWNTTNHRSGAQIYYWPVGKPSDPLYSTQISGNADGSTTDSSFVCSIYGPGQTLLKSAIHVHAHTTGWMFPGATVSASMTITTSRGGTVIQSQQFTASYTRVSGYPRFTYSGISAETPQVAIDMYTGLITD